MQFATLIRFFLISILLFCNISWADDFYHRHPLGMMIFRGDYSTTSLIDNAQFKVNKVHGETMYGLGFFYAFKNYCFVENFPLVNFLTGIDFYLVNDLHKDIYQANPFLAINILSPVLFNFVCVGLTLGDGISFSTGIPTYELQEGGTSKTLNYLFYDLVLVFPKYRQFQLLYHTAHRCNCHGFIYSPHDSVVGSTAIGIGLRYLF